MYACVALLRLKSSRATAWYWFWGSPPPASWGRLFSTLAKIGKLAGRLLKGPAVVPTMAETSARVSTEPVVAGPPPYALKNAWVAEPLAAMNSGVGTQLISVAFERTRMYSPLAKKWILSFWIGPPMLKPIWWRLNLPWSIPFALLSKVLVERPLLRKNSYTVPRYWLVPDFVATFTTPPEARPYWAEKFEVRTENSCTESSGTAWPTLAVKSSLLAEPSSSTFVLADRAPLIA